MKPRLPIPTGLRHSAQGCRVGEATLGHLVDYFPQPQRGCITVRAHGFNPVGVGFPSSGLEKGFLDDFLQKVEAEVAADYMGQAEGLLKEGQTGAFDHVQAAVLSGAVLEKALRTLCDRQQPQISITNANGENKTLNPLIDDLKKAGAFNELKAKQLRAWADIRNKAAHGEFNQFTKADVEQMLAGIANFLADYLQ